MKIDHDKFLTACGNFSESQKQGMDALLTFMENDSYMTDIRWCAYLLATIGRECGGEWQPIEEYGKGQGHPYGEPDPHTGLVYYGRGYTQNTWYSNYLMLTHAWNANHPDEQVDFTLNPELLLVPKYSYWCTSHAVRNGSYTGVSFAHYIHDDTCDFFNCRRVINGTDDAQDIADAATWFLQTLQECSI